MDIPERLHIDDYYKEEAAKDETGKGKKPRLLLIGDSISEGYVPVVKEFLKGKMEVIHVPCKHGTTGEALKNINSWLELMKWDIVHFNGYVIKNIHSSACKGISVVYR